MSTHSADSVEKPASINFNRQISLYSLAASAASVGVLALAQPAQSEVVVTDHSDPGVASG